MDIKVACALLDTMQSLCESGDVRAIVLTGDGTAFSAGGDIQDQIREMGVDQGVRDAILGERRSCSGS